MRMWTENEPGAGRYPITDPIPQPRSLRLLGGSERNREINTSHDLARLRRTGSPWVRPRQGQHRAIARSSRSILVGGSRLDYWSRIGCASGR
jgi:hypothetical protein